MDLEEIVRDDVDWVDLVPDGDMWVAFAKAVINLSGFVKCTELLDCLRNDQLLEDSDLWCQIY
jgi:hypothetical protein